ncbi:MAG: hypothetical protein COX46_04495 [bacterium (Candidatus Ratteibacteria) CG23_combo_of_CG06-09_8_20_14_all_48_7]|uniref:TonB-dependent receptor n=1 Tax=bacterium (Candidatus Ratteibacteria) CG23_combo_of_CG06-09_8_20_14_all_48_7 TaxID=2014292 RepID=A0A2G9YBB0_9BACT|nr:MAG: hypothetical protein COX46_04495 [bacterium (Candidatus Ratteibacteria) CG23_combo_of_CG06-09_8_20_14_all_48_7]
MERQKNERKGKWFLGLVTWSTVFSLLLVPLIWSEEKEEEVTALEEIVVTATRTPQSAEEVPVSVTVVTRSEIEDSKAQNVGEVLDTLPGVQMRAYGSMGSQSSLSIRGSSTEQILILLDGRPLNLGSLGSYDLSLIPIEMVERIEVLRGPASALYGANALGGVINIITRNIPKEPFFTSNLQYGSFNTTLLSFTGGRKDGRFGYILSGQYNYSDGDRENSGDEENHFFGKFTLDLNKNSSLAFSSGFDKQDVEVPGSVALPMPLANQKTTEDRQDVFYGFAGERGEFTGRLFFNHNKVHFQNPDPAWPTDSTIKNRQTGLELQQNYSPNEIHLLTIGGDYLKDEVKSESTGSHAPEREAIFIQDQITFKKATLVLGGRVDEHSVYGSEFSPRIAGRFNLSEDTILRSSLGKAYRAPTVNDLYWYEEWWPGAGMFGNEDLKPEEGISYDLGVEHKFSKNLSATATFFRNDVEDLISWVETIPWTRYDVQNIGEARLQGVETELKWFITERLSFSVNHTYLKSEDQDTGKKLTYRPENRVGSFLSYSRPSGFKAQLEGEYNDVSYADAANTRKVDEYFLLSLILSKKVSPNLELFAKGENLFGEEYEILDGYPMPQTTITVGLNANF